MHTCCQGKGTCIEKCKDIIGETVRWNDNPIIEWHIQKIICNFQKQWFGHTKYCICPFHVKLIKGEKICQ